MDTFVVTFVCFAAWLTVAVFWSVTDPFRPLEEVIWWPIHLIKFLLKSFVEAVFTGWRS